MRNARLRIHARQYVRRLRPKKPVPPDPGIEALLTLRPSDLRGDVLEEHEPLYTQHFDTAEVAAVCVVDPGPYNRWVTHLANLAECDALPTDRFDCVILSRALDEVGDAGTALANAWQSLRPGGVLFAGYRGDYARLAPEINRSCPGSELEVASVGERCAVRVKKAVRS